MGGFESHHLHVASVFPQVHFFGFVSGRQSALLSHWLAHYAALGVRMRDRAHVVLHTGARDAHERAEVAASRAELRRAHVREVREVHAYTSDLKEAAVNAYLATLPEGALLIYPDLDEFFGYGCRMLDEAFVTPARPASFVVNSMQARP
jgi:hypothetical protein